MRSLKKPQQMKTIIPLSNGIFSHMDYDFRAEVTKANLDILFISNYGKKNPSPIVETLQDDYGEELTSEQLTTLAAIIVEMYSNKWNKLGEIYDIEYDPIHNYLDEWEDASDETVTESDSEARTKNISYGKVDSTTSTRTDDLESSRSVTESETRTRTDSLSETETRDLSKSGTRTDNLTETNTYGKTSTRTDNLTETLDQDTSGTSTGSEAMNTYGFNSSDAVSKDSSSDSDSSSESLDSTTTNTGTQAIAESGSDGKSNTGTQTNTETDTGTVTTTNSGTQQNSLSGTVSDTTSNTGTQSKVTTDTQSGIDTITDNKTGNASSVSDRDRSGRHFGNIGNLTSQKQILEEINLWKWNYINEILNDVKEFCCLPVYLNHRVLVDDDDE